MAKIVNKRTGKALAEAAELCAGRWRQARGLMFSSPRSLVFVLPEERIVPLHMLFVFFPIDVLYLDSGCRVVELKERLMPFRFHTPKSKARYVIEVSAGTIVRSSTRRGDEISFSETFI